MVDEAPRWNRAENAGWTSPDQRVRRIDDAVVTPFAVRRPENSRDRFITGSVYDQGVLVDEAVRRGGTRGDIVYIEDPLTLTDVPADLITGTWLYGGHLIGQFGHFICESLTNLWPVDEKVDGILFHSFIFGRAVQPWMRELIKMAGWPDDIDIRVIGDSARVEHLVVPTRPFEINVGAAPEAVSVWERVSSPGRANGAPVFLSRSRLTDDPRRMPGDDELDGEFAGLGFKVIHPQTLGVRQQIGVVQSAPIVAALSGSALHLSAFSAPGTRVLEIGDARTHSAPLINQIVIDAARGHSSAFVPYLTRDGHRDVEATMVEVASLLVASVPKRKRGLFNLSRK